MEERAATSNMTQPEERMQKNCQEQQQERKRHYLLRTSCENA